MGEKDPKEIYLQPPCCAGVEGRLWSEDDEPEGCEDGKPWTRYVLASDNEARIGNLMNLLALAVCPICDGSGAIPVANMRDTGDSDLLGYPIMEEELNAEQCQWCFERQAAVTGNDDEEVSYTG